MTATRVRLAGGIAVLLALVVLSGTLPQAPGRPDTLVPGTAVSGTAVSGTAGSGTVAPGTGRSVLLCPNGAPTSDSTLDLGVYPARAPRPATGDTALTVRQLTGGDRPDRDDLEVPAPGRGQSVVKALPPDGVGVQIDAGGRLAQGLWASVASKADSGESAGLAVAGCIATRPEYVFGGLSEQQGQHAQIQLVNPDQAEARVDLELFDTRGPLPDAESRLGISVPGGDRRTLDLDDLAAGSDRVVARVEVKTGRVAAFAFQSARSGETPGGADWAAPSQAGTSLVLPGVSASVDQVRLAVATLGADSGTAKIEVLDSNGAHRPAGHDTVRLTAGKVSELDLSEVFHEEPAAVRVTADVPVTAALSMTAGRRLTAGAEPRPGELALAGAAAPLAGPVAFAGRGDATQAALQLTAVGQDTSVEVRIRNRDGSTYRTRTDRLRTDTTTRIDLAGGALGRQVAVTPADPDVVVGAVVFSAAGRHPELSVLPLG